MEVALEGLVEAAGEDGGAILSTLAIANEDAAPAEVNVLHAESEGLGEPKATAVEEVGHESILARRHRREQPAHLIAGEDGGEPFRAIRSFDCPNVTEGFVEDRFVEKRQGIEGLILRGRGHMAVGSQVVEEALDIRCVEVAGMGRIVEADEAGDPAHLRLFGVEAVLAASTRLSNAGQELRRLVGGACAHETGPERGRLVHLIS